MRILLIEDDPRIQKLERLALQRVFGVDVTIDVVDNAGAAISAIAEATELDLVVSDFDLKYSNGAEVLAWVRANRPALLGRFVFMTGRYDLDELHDKVIDKLDIRELGARLRALVPFLFPSPATEAA